MRGCRHVASNTLHRGLEIPPCICPRIGADLRLCDRALCHGETLRGLGEVPRLGCKQKLRCAVNDRLGIEPDAAP